MRCDGRAGLDQLPGHRPRDRGPGPVCRSPARGGVERLGHRTGVPGEDRRLVGGPRPRAQAQGAPQEAGAEPGLGGAAGQVEPVSEQCAGRPAFVAADGVRGRGPPGDAQGERRVPAGAQQCRDLGVGPVRGPAGGGGRRRHTVPGEWFRQVLDGAGGEPHPAVGDERQQGGDDRRSARVEGEHGVDGHLLVEGAEQEASGPLVGGRFGGGEERRRVGVAHDGAQRPRQRGAQPRGCRRGRAPAGGAGRRPARPRRGGRPPRSSGCSCSGGGDSRRPPRRPSGPGPRPAPTGPRARSGCPGPG
ncbi:hypothetical protein SGRI78S_07344 [Streptomyces griseus subsp. griseus]